MSTATVKELRHEFPRVYAAARRAPAARQRPSALPTTPDPARPPPLPYPQSCST